MRLKSVSNRLIELLFEENVLFTLEKFSKIQLVAGTFNHYSMLTCIVLGRIFYNGKIRLIRYGTYCEYNEAKHHFLNRGAIGHVLESSTMRCTQGFQQHQIL